MRTARVIIDEPILFECFGMKHFHGKIKKVEIYDNGIEFYVEGFDERIPDRSDYPLSFIRSEKVISKIEVIE